MRTSDSRYTGLCIFRNEKPTVGSCEPCTVTIRGGVRNDASLIRVGKVRAVGRVDQGGGRFDG